jgi:hypothetical protein
MFEIECASFIVTQSTADVTACPGRYRFLFKAALLGEAMKGTPCINPVTAVNGNVLTKAVYRYITHS